MAENKRFSLPGSRWNVIIDAVNRGAPIDKAGLENETEKEIYKELVAEADRYEERGGVRPVFDSVEIESDDPSLDIYSEPV